MVEPETECARELRSLSELAASFEELRAELGVATSSVVTEISRWSVEQHLYHAALSADLALENVRAILEGTSARIVQEGAPNELAKRVFAEGGYPRGQSTSPRTVWPPDRPDPKLLHAEIERLRRGIAELAPRTAAIACAAGRIPHRELGTLSAAEWLRFARLHTAHHLAIAREIRTAGCGRR